MARPPVPSGFTCYHCGSDKTFKAGLTSNGKKRFKCPNCKKNFREGPVITESGKKLVPAVLPSVSHMILELQAIYQRIGKPPTTAIINKLAKENKAYKLNLYYAVFGSFLNALKRSRIKSRYLQEFDKDDKLLMLNQLRRLSQKLNRPLLAKDFPALGSGTRFRRSTISLRPLARSLRPSTLWALLQNGSTHVMNLSNI